MYEQPTQNPPATTPAFSVDADKWQKIVVQCCLQIKTSRDFKKSRMDQIKENENLYYGLTEKSIRNPYNECFPFMAGFVDYLRARIDDDSTLTYSHQSESDLKRANKVQAFYEQESKSIESNASWDLKHRLAKFNAILSGVAIYNYYSEKNPNYKSCLEVVSHYDFHCEPRGGSILENHLFIGIDNIYKNKSDIEGSAFYKEEEVKKLVTGYATAGFKETNDVDNNRNNRLQANKQDPVTHNYVGQDTYKLSQFYTTYEGKRYYCLFNEQLSVGIRVCPIEEMFPSGLYPVIAWHTNEDGDMFWSKSPADDARGTARIINIMINQELYNRQKRNYGKIGYDVSMFPNVQALADWRPDGLIPMDLSGGKQIQQGIYEFKVGDLNGTLDLVTWLDAFTGKQIGRTASGAGQAESDKKVGVFEGEIEQIDQLINVKNKSYRYCLSCLGLRFKQGLDANLSKEVAIKIMGPTGVDWQKFGPEDLKTDQDLNIQAVGGSTEVRLKQIKDTKKSNALVATMTVNPQWKDRAILLLAGFTEEETKEAFSTGSFAQKELLSEAAQAEKDIVEGKKVKLNSGADEGFIQHILDYEIASEDITPEIRSALRDYALAHIDIAIKNGEMNIKQMIRDRLMKQFNNPAPAPSGKSTATPSPIPTSVPAM